VHRVLPEAGQPAALVEAAVLALDGTPAAPAAAEAEVRVETPAVAAVEAEALVETLAAPVEAAVPALDGTPAVPAVVEAQVPVETPAEPAAEAEARVESLADPAAAEAQAWDETPAAPVAAEAEVPALDGTPAEPAAAEAGARVESLADPAEAPPRAASAEPRVPVPAPCAFVVVLLVQAGHSVDVRAGMETAPLERDAGFPAVSEAAAAGHDRLADDNPALAADPAVGAPRFQNGFLGPPAWLQARVLQAAEPVHEIA